MIEANFADLVDEHGGVAKPGIAEQPIEKRGLAGAEKAGNDAERNGLDGPELARRCHAGRQRLTVAAAAAAAAQSLATARWAPSPPPRCGAWARIRASYRAQKPAPSAEARPIFRLPAPAALSGRRTARRLRLLPPPPADRARPARPPACSGAQPPERIAPCWI